MSSHPDMANITNPRANQGVDRLVLESGIMPRPKRDPTNPLLQKNFMAPAKMLARLQRYAEKVNESESEIIRRAAEEYLTANV